MESPTDRATESRLSVCVCPSIAPNQPLGLYSSQLSSMSAKPLLDFNVVREPWNKYELADGSVLKLKVVLTKVRKRVVDQKPVYEFEAQTIIVVLLPDDLKRPPHTKSYSPDELRATIVKDDIRYPTVSEEWNEYVVGEEARVGLKPPLSASPKHQNITRIVSPFTDFGEKAYGFNHWMNRR